MDNAKNAEIRKDKICAVLLDYGKVLSAAPAPEDWRRLEAVLGAEPERFETAYWKYRDAYDRGALSAQRYWETVAGEIGNPLDAQPLGVRTLHALIDADTVVWTRPNTAMMDWAARLHRAGIKTGILSNIGDAMEVGVLERFPALADLSHHTFSHRLGVAKPDAAIYRHAVEGLGAPAEDILFVDDKEENIRGAREAGMAAIQYSSHGAFVTEMDRMGLGWLLAV